MFTDEEINFHTHTPRCKHAVGTPEEFCAQAVRNGFKVLGFSDHAPFPPNHPCENRGDRMDASEVGDYCRDIRAVSTKFPELKVLLGLELDYIPDMTPYVKMYRQDHPCDFLLGSAHRILHDGKVIVFISKESFSEEIMLKFFDADWEMIESGLVDIIAHPDAAASSFPEPFTPKMEKAVRRIAHAAKVCNIPLEINANGIRKKPVPSWEGERWGYPWTPFWQIVKEEDAPVIVGADAHSAKDLGGPSFEQAFQFVKTLGLRNVATEFTEKLLQKLS